MYHSRWLPILKGFKECFPRLLADVLQVEHLILAIGQWNSMLIKNSFLSFKADMILSLPRPLSDKEDSYCFHYDPKGVCLARSAYKLSIDDSAGIPSSFSLSLADD